MPRYTVISHRDNNFDLYNIRGEKFYLPESLALNEKFALDVFPLYAVVDDPFVLDQVGSEISKVLWCTPDKKDFIKHIDELREIEDLMKVL